MPNRWLTVPLLVLMPFVARAGLGLAREATSDERLSRVLAPALALAAWLVAVHTTGLVTHSFYAGLGVGTAIVAASSVALARRGKPAAAIAGPGASEVASAPALWMWAGAAAAMAILAGPEIFYAKHDECLIVGHLSLPAEMLNGVYPPRHLAFPSFELRYHYGTDLLTAAVSALLGRLDVRFTLHALTLLLWGYSFVLFWVLGERLIGGRASGPITATCVLFAGGAPYFCRPLDPIVPYLTSDCREAGIWITPPFVSSFLQHPWTLGMPLFGAALLLVVHFGSDLPAVRGAAVLALVVVGLALAQAVLFVCLVPCLVVTGAFE
ncbi:MAG: hypothetical protein ACRENE_07050, partial [Polyangiaceae bacterium]